MTREQSLLIDILGKQLFGKDTETNFLNAEEREAVLEEAKHQAVFPIAFAYLDSEKPDDEAFLKYRKQNDVYTIAGIRNLHTHSLIHRLLDTNGIAYVILKGQASARYYPDPMLRPMGDVDFLVDRKDLDRVAMLLEAEGFRKLEQADNHEFHWAYSKGKAKAELHWEVPGVPKSDNEIINSYLTDIIEKRELIDASDHAFYVSSAFHHGMVILLHTISHITTKGIGLRHLCDWLVFENSMPEDVFTEMFSEAIREMGLLTFAQVLTRIGILYFGCAERQWCREADKDLCTNLLEDILAGGNFGRKEEGRGSQAMLFRNSQTRKVSHSDTLKNAFASMKRRAEIDYPICRTIPVLSPIIWSIVVVQYLLRVAQGKKYSMIDREHIKEAMRRQSIYEELKLFER